MKPPEIDGYDAEFYGTELVRAAESVLSLAGWREDGIKRYLADRVKSSIGAFGE